jgi:hypothetical protein
MTKMHICDVCQYSTKDMSNYKKHNLTKKHKKQQKQHNDYVNKNLSDNNKSENSIADTLLHSIVNGSIKKNVKSNIEKLYKNNKNNTNIDNDDIDKLWICAYCNHSFSRIDSRVRHERYCSKKIIKEREKELSNKDETISNKDETISSKDKALQQKDEEIHYLRQILKLSEENNGAISKFKYVNTNYVSTKPLRILTYARFKKNNKIQYIANELSYEDRFIKELLYYHRKSRSGEYIGKTVVKIHTHKDPERISFWATDCTRLKFVVRTKSKEKSGQWETDMGGNMIMGKIINPIMEKTKNLIDEYYERHCITDPDIKYSSDSQRIIMKEREDLLDIKEEIELKKLHKKVLQYVAPKFNVKKTNSTDSTDS